MGEEIIASYCKQLLLLVIFTSRLNIYGGEGGGVIIFGYCMRLLPRILLAPGEYLWLPWAIITSRDFFSLSTIYIVRVTVGDYYLHPPGIKLGGRV